MSTLSRRSIRSWPASLVAIASLGMACDALAEQQQGAQESITAPVGAQGKKSVAQCRG